MIKGPSQSPDEIPERKSETARSEFRESVLDGHDGQHCKIRVIELSQNLRNACFLGVTDDQNF